MEMKILFVDDDKNLLDSLYRNFKNEFSIDLALGPEIAVSKIKENPQYSVIIVDMTMPGMNGIELLSVVKELSPETVKIMLTGNADLKVAIDAVNKGAVYKFLIKPCNLDELKQIINEGIAEYKKIFDKEALIQGSLKDALTGLYNRKELNSRLIEEEKRIERYIDENEIKITIMFIDLDNFKYYNDTFGHDIGDLLLKEFASLILKNIRTTDFAARFGGDEFVIIMPETDETNASITAKRILDNLSENAFFKPQIESLLKKKIVITENKILGCSIGIASAGKKPVLLNDVMKKADEALLVSKKSGKNRFTISE